MEKVKLNTVKLAPTADFDNEPSLHFSQLFERATITNNAEVISIKQRPAIERDSIFQRMLASVISYFKPKAKNLLSQESLSEVSIPGVLTTGQSICTNGAVVLGKLQLRTLYYLLNADGSEGIPISELQHQVDCRNQWDIVARLNSKFSRNIIDRTKHLAKNKTGKVAWRSNYVLTAEGRLVATQLLANAGYVHDVTFDSSHRPELTAREFIALSSLNDDDLLFLRDGHRPQWVRLLYLLRAVDSNWVPRYVADELLDSRNICEVVRQVVKKLGGNKNAIRRITLTKLNRDGSKSKYGLYQLAGGWFGKAEKLIQAAQDNN